MNISILRLFTCFRIIFIKLFEELSFIEMVKSDNEIVMKRSKQFGKAITIQTP
jgi:hypothetical protein